ncbi:nucleotidyltransferase family protein [Acidianus brierleyi]|uniref:Polymerase nucleotidyl transferase domain-containing protein n=1 Tax=Acidianus brierleyi TaxID=41673 RepID=A0A2U9IH92_9CREN|nr:hypothetical protein DFR85_13065 [Acidianus brierleyi]
MEKEMKLREAHEVLGKLIGLYPNTTVILFGSRASGKNRPNSDFDIIVFIECENPLRELPCPNGRSFLLQSRGLPKVEVSAPQALRVVPTPIFLGC